MRNVYRYTLLAALAFSFAACQQEDDFAPQQSGNEVTITAQVGKAQTRAAVNDLTHVQTNGFGFFCAGGTKYDKNNLKVTYCEGAWTTAEKILSPGKGTTMNIFAYYPYDENRTSASEDYAVTLATDQSTGLLAADHLVATGSLVLNGTTESEDLKYENGNLTIAFRHAFSKVRFNLNLKDQFSEGGSVTKVEVEAPVSAILNGATVTIPANSETGKVQICKEETAATGYTASYEGIILPGTYTYKVHFTMSNGTVQTYAATSAHEFKQNYAYTQNITIGKDGVKLVGTEVAQWGSTDYEHTGEVKEIYITSIVKGVTAAIDICSENTDGIITDIQGLLSNGATTLTVNGTLSDTQQSALATALTNFNGTLIMDMTDVADAINNLTCEKQLGGYAYNEADNTYTVYTAAGLQTWGEAACSNLATGLTLGADIIMPSTMNIDNNGDGINESNWACIVPEMSSDDYKGTIKGNNHTIYNLSMTGNGNDFPSFIGYKCNGATISNLNFADIRLTGGYSVAAIVLMSYGSVIENCHVLNGTIEGEQYVAGIVGRTQIGSRVVNCSNAATISSEEYAGGITCDVYAYGTTTEMLACCNSGEIKGRLAGGIATTANDNGTVAGCYNTGTVTGTDYAGGITFRASSNVTVTACYNTGAVTGSTCGGIVGTTTGTTYTLTYNYTGGSMLTDNNSETTTVDGTTNTWEAAMTAMNTTLTEKSLGWEYVQNTGSDASTCPLVIQAKTATTE